MSITQNDDQGGQSSTDQLVQRYANMSLHSLGRADWHPWLLKHLRSHYESLLRPSHTWHRWAVGRIASLRGISMALSSGIHEGNITKAGIQPLLTYRWINTADPYFGNPFSWPRLSLLWHSPLWRWWLQMPAFIEAEPGEAMSLEYYTAGEHLTEPPTLAEQQIMNQLPSRMLLRDDSPHSSKEALAERRGGPPQLIPRLSPADITMSHRIALVLSRSSPKLASRPLSLLYPETELIYSQAYSPLGMGVRHIVPLDSSGEGGILPYPQWEPLPALTENMQPLHYTMVTLSAAGERTASPLRPPIFSVVMPTLAAKDITFRHFDLPVLSHSVLPLSIGMYPAPRASSWPSLNMPLVYAVRSDLTRIYSFDSENRESEGAALGEEQAEEGETDATTSWAPMKETQPSFHPMLPQQALSPSMELVSIKTPFSSSQPGALKPEKVGLTFAASLLGEVMRRQREMLVSDREEASAEAGLPSIVTMPPPRLQSLAVSKPHEPYLTREASDGLPTMAIHRGDDLLTSAMPQAQSAAFGKPLSHGRLPWANKALFSSRQWARKLKGDDDLYSTFNPTLEMAGLITDGEGALAPSYEEIEPSAQALYGSEPVPLPLVGEANDTLMALGDALARPYPKMDLWAETTTRPPSWSGGSARPKVSSPSSLSPYPPAPMGGYGGFSLPPVASSITPSQGSSSQPTVARAPIDRPTGGDQTGETEQGAPLDEIAEEVYAILKRRLALERERSWGIG